MAESEINRAILEIVADVSERFYTLLTRIVFPSKSTQEIMPQVFNPLGHKNSADPV